MKLYSSLLKSFLGLGRKQSNNIIKLLVGQPVTYPSFGSVTLDKDDVELARFWIKNKNEWYRTKEVEQYNERFAEWNGSSYAFSFMGGRIALSAIIYALDLHPDDEVILPGYTCIVVPNAFEYSGVKPIYCDIELETYGLDASSIEAKISPKTKAIMIHHLYGLVCRDYELLIKLAIKHNLKVIEDCAHSTGAEYKGKKVGNYGHAAFYSSEQSKIFNTVQGGIAVTNDHIIAGKIKEYYDDAEMPDPLWIDRQLHTLILNYYQFKHPKRFILGDLFNLIYGRKRLISTTIDEECGIKPIHYGRKMPAPIASIGINQLKKIDRYNTLRRKTAQKWNFWCDNYGYKKPLIIKDSVPVFLRYPVLVEREKKKNRNWAIKELGIYPGVWFISNVHPVKKDGISFTNANTAVNRCINFPSIL